MTGLIRTAILATMLLALPAGALSSTAPHVGATASEDYRPGQDGVDFTAITGAKGSQLGKLPACADPARRGNLRPC